MAAPRHPAAYLCHGPGMPATTRRQELMLAARQRGWPAPDVYSEPDAVEYGAALDALEAAIAAGRHDAVLMTAPASPAPLMRLLSRCTKLGVMVSFLPPAWTGRRRTACCCGGQEAGGPAGGELGDPRQGQTGGAGRDVPRLADLAGQPWLARSPPSCGLSSGLPAGRTHVLRACGYGHGTGRPVVLAARR